MGRSREEAADEVARDQVELATAAAGATPLAELDPTIRDLSRVQPLLEQLAAAVARLLGTDTAAVWVTDPSEDVLVASAWVGFPDDYIGSMRVPFGAGSAGRAVAERRTVLVRDVESSPYYLSFRQGALAHGIRAVLSVPMLTLAGEPIGALSTYYGAVVAAHNPRDLELVELYARQAAEIVERARLHGQARQLAALERQRALQLRTLAGSALTLTAAETLDDLLRLVTDAAREVVGCHQAVTTRLPSGWVDATTCVSLSEKYAEWRGCDVVPQGRGVFEAVTRENRPTGVQLHQHPEWCGLLNAPGHPPLPDYLAAPLVGRDGANLGLIQLSDKLDGAPFSAEDEAMLVQLAQLASATVERLEAFEGEREARREAQRVAEVQNLLSEAAAVFAERFDPAGITAALAEVVVPRFATLAVVHVVDGEGRVSLSALQTADPGDRAATTAVFAGLPIRTDQRNGPGAVLATGRLQALPELTPERLERYVPEPDRLAVLLRSAGRHGVCVPLTARGSVVGVLSLTRSEPYDAAEVEQALDLARRAALALDNANRYAFERDLAMTLQRSLLPRSLPTGAAFRSAARYLPGGRGTQVGGDWYDVVEVGDSLIMVVGDVMGRGVTAAAVMGQLQATVRAYALEGHSPADILRGLDAVALRIEDLDFTTCVVASLDLRAGTLCLASAGHLPPVIVAPDGTARLLELDPGLPLGVGGGQFVQESLAFAPGSLVLLYTDGLVETRDASVEVGLDRLVRSLGRPVASAEQACERVLTALGRNGDTDDDTAVLAVLLAPPPDLELALPGEVSSAAVARHALRDLLVGLDLDPDVGQLLVTELVANAVRHAGPGDLTVRVRVTAGVVLVEVEDTSPWKPESPVQPPWHKESGRGLLLVDVLTERWGVDTVGTGKRVWFEFAPDPA